MGTGHDSEAPPSDKANVQLCPRCETQVARDPLSKRKTLDCPMCKMRFFVRETEGTGTCAHCHKPVTMASWVVGHDVLCPECRGVLRLRWERDD